MRKTMVKRLVYYSPTDGSYCYGGTEYDAHLTDENILGGIHEVGKTEWINGNLWLMRDGEYIYRLSVETFPQYTKTRLDLFLDAIRRI